MNNLPDLIQPTGPNTPVGIQPYEQNYQPLNLDFFNSGGTKQPNTLELAGQSFNDFVNAPNDVKYASKTFDWNRSNADRYVKSDYYRELGFNPDKDNESLYGYRQTWGNTLGNALGGAWKLGANGFVDGWKGWGRMGDALVHMDWTKLMGDEESLKSLNDTQNQVMNENAIFSTPESDATFWNRKTFGNFLQQSGFTVGTIAQMVTEQALTKLVEVGLTATGVGIGAAGALETIEDAKTANSIRALSKMFTIQKAAKELNEAGAIWKNEQAVGNMFKALAGKLPGVSIFTDMKAAKDMGFSTGVIAAVGVGGVKRALSEANLAMTEARMEAAGTYGGLYDQMYYDHLDKTGQAPSADDLKNINKAAYSAGKDNFVFNTMLLSAMNRIQFDNMFKSFKVGSKLGALLAKEEEQTIASQLLKVTGDIEGKSVTQFYKKGMFGTLGIAGDIAKDFGKKAAAKEVGFGLLKNMGKWEVSEGVQELLQNGSNDYITDYYTDLYNGVPANRSKSLDVALNKEASMEGLKTFMSGALTGFITSGPSHLVSKGFQNLTSSRTERNEANQKVQNFANEYNAFLKNPAVLLSEVNKNFNIQADASDSIDKALKNKDKFTFENIRETALAQLAARAVRMGTHEPLLDTLRDYGTHMSKTEFEEAFTGIGYTDKNKTQAVDYINKVADSVESYTTAYQNLHDKLDNKINPDIYRQGTIARKEAELAKHAQDSVIELLAGNAFKAEQSLKRMTDIYNKAAANKNFGASLASTFNVLSAEDNTANELSILKQEIKSLEQTPGKDRETSQILKHKKAQLEAITLFSEHRTKYYEAVEKADNVFHVIDNKGNYESGYKTVEEANKRVDDLHKESVKQLYKGFKDFVNSKNQESGLNVNVSDSDYNEQFGNLNDYIRLNQKTKAHTDAYNLIINPKNFIKLQNRLHEGARAAALRIQIELIENTLNKRGFSAANEDLIKEIKALSEKQDKTDDEIVQYHELLKQLAQKAAEYTDKQNQEYIDKLKEIIFRNSDFRKANKAALDKFDEVSDELENYPPDSDKYKEFENLFNEICSILLSKAESYLKSNKTDEEVKTEAPVADVDKAKQDLEEKKKSELEALKNPTPKAVAQVEDNFNSQINALDKKVEEQQKAKTNAQIVEERVNEFKNVNTIEEANTLIKNLEDEMAMDPNSPLLALEPEDINKIVESYENRIKELPTFARILPYSIIEYRENGKNVYYQVIHKTNDNRVEVREYPNSSSSFTLTEEQINKNTVNLYKNAADLKLNPKPTVTTEEQAKATESQNTSKDFFTDGGAVQKAIEEADKKSSDQIANDLLASLGCE